MCCLCSPYWLTGSLALRPSNATRHVAIQTHQLSRGSCQPLALSKGRRAGITCTDSPPSPPPWGSLPPLLTHTPPPKTVLRALSCVPRLIVWLLCSAWEEAFNTTKANSEGPSIDSLFHFHTASISGRGPEEGWHACRMCKTSSFSYLSWWGNYKGED